MTEALPTDFAKLSDQEQTMLYLTASPVGIEYGTGVSGQLQKKTEEFRALPENVRRVLFAEETSWRIYQLVGAKYHFSQKQTGEVAKILQQVLTGEESGSGMAELIRVRCQCESDAANQIAAELAKEFITPNYYQVAQLYEKKHGAKGVGSRVSGVGTNDGSGSRDSESVKPPRVIDLRNGSVPSRLPPATPIGGTSVEIDDQNPS